MKTRPLFLSILALLFQLFAVEGQTDSSFAVDNYSEELENVLENADIAETDLLEEMADRMTANRHSGINLNALEYETAVHVLHLTDYQYYQLQLYIEKYGALCTIYELLVIDGFSEDDFRRIQRIAVVIPAKQRLQFFRDFFRKSSTQMLLRYRQPLLSQGSDATTTKPLDNLYCYGTFSTQDRLMFKFLRCANSNTSAKKSGFCSGSVCVGPFGIMKILAVGDFRVNFGQGLIAGSSFISGRGGSIDHIRRFSGGIKATASSSQSTFVRGCALTIGNTALSGSLFAGHLNNSFKNCTGFNLSWRKPIFSVGLSGAIFSAADTSLPLTERIRTSLKPETGNVSVDYQLLVRRQVLYGEIAVTDRKKICLLQNALFHLTSSSKLAVVFRHYAKGYDTPLGNALKAASASVGETGIYIASRHILGKQVEAELLFDYYRLSEPSYRTDAPVAASYFGGTLLYSPARQCQISCRYTINNKPENGKDNPYYREIQNRTRHKLHIQCNSEPCRNLKTKTVIDWLINVNATDKTRNQGVLFYQDIAINLSRPKLAVTFRFAYFDTDSFAERLYAYEHNVYRAFSFGTYYGKGVREYLVFRYSRRWFSISFRVSHTLQIDGDSAQGEKNKAELTGQVMFSL
jgi:hypothetical protein